MADPLRFVNVYNKLDYKQTPWRRSGNTTRMLTQAVKEMEAGNNVVLIFPGYMVASRSLREYWNIAQLNPNYFQFRQDSIYCKYTGTYLKVSTPTKDIVPIGGRQVENLYVGWDNSCRMR